MREPLEGFGGSHYFCSYVGLEGLGGVHSRSVSLLHSMVEIFASDCTAVICLASNFVCLCSSFGIQHLVYRIIVCIVGGAYFGEADVALCTVWAPCGPNELDMMPRVLCCWAP